LIEFENSWMILGLIFIPVYFYWYSKLGRKQEGSLRISSKLIISKEMIRIGNLKVKSIQILQTLIFSFIVIALARPRIVNNLQKTKVEVVDIVLVLDISSSMLATDFKPNRLEVVKQTADKFIMGRQGDRLALLVFAGETFIQCPLTMDLDVISALLNKVNVVEKEYDGTAIGIGIANAINRLRSSAAESKVIILLSDGSNNAGELDPLTAADLAAQFNIKIYTIGAGTNQQTSFIPNRGYIRNEIDEETLKDIAARTKGVYFRATNAAVLESIYKQIDELERTEIEVREYVEYKELFPWFLIPALILGLVVESLEKTVFRRLI